jgi:hypothetical protein
MSGQPYPGPSVSGQPYSGPPSSGPPAGGSPGGYPHSTPGLRDLGGPSASGAGNPNAYYPGQQQPHFPAPNPMESSGSLTGHILSAGRADAPTPKSRTARVVIIMVVVLAVVVGLGFLAATVFNDFLSGLLGGITGG